jgi:hypothetical protein
MTSLRSHAIVSLVSLAVGGASAWYLRPPVVETRTEYKDRVVEVVKTIREQVKTQTRRQVKTRTEEKPDGTKITVRTETGTETKTETDTRSDGQKTASTEKVSVDRYWSPDWSVRGLAGVDLRSKAFTYGAAVERRVVGPVWLGAWALSSGVVGASVGVTF